MLNQMLRTLIAACLIGAVAVALQAQQAPGVADVEEFDAASIKPNNSVEQIGRIIVAGGTFRANNVNAETLVWMAYGKGRRLVNGLMKGGPDWIKSDRYDVMAKADAPQMNLRSSAPALQRLLADRFQLRVHVEQQLQPVLALIRARPDRLGPSITSATADCSATSPTRNQCNRARFGDGTFDAVGYSVETVAASLTTLVQQIVIDDTALSGVYNLSLSWNESGQNNDRPSIFTAVEEQWGLKLEPRKAPVDVVIIDSVRRPSPD